MPDLEVIFDHTDDDGDQFQIVEDDLGFVLRVESGMDLVLVRFDDAAAAQMAENLTRHLQ